MWRAEPPPPEPPLDAPGGIFGVHLGRPHRITTTFNFRDVAGYRDIQAYLSQIGLVELSDRHVRPKAAVPTPPPRRPGNR
jgi:hypothetical protein